jgi:Holliday junction resolvasome RuvABC endonuclease subunit
VNILSIDPAAQLGWASNQHGKISYGSNSFHNAKWDGAGYRFLKFRKWLEQWKDVDLVAYESVQSHTSTYAAHAYGGWIAVLQAWCEYNDVPYTGVPVGTIKKFWTGNGGCRKSAMIKEAQARGFNPQDDNDADALAILHYAIEHLAI